MENEIILPRTDKEGKPRYSYSQHKLWNEKKSFNLGVKGKIEYIVSYFLKHEFKDKGWGEFGRDVESYITERKKGETFTKEEIRSLEHIKPLGVFQDKFSIPFKGFNLIGVIDDRTEDFSLIRDYKTASKNSASQYYDGGSNQLEIYAIKAYLETGLIPDLEYFIIERKGNCMWKGGRKDLTVAGPSYTIKKETSLEALDSLKKDIKKSVKEISNCYKLFLKFNKL